MKRSPVTASVSHLAFRRASFLALVAAAMLAALPAAAQESYQQIQYPPLRAIQLPTVDRTVLPNGLVLYLVEDHSLPKVEGYALIHTGARFEPADKAGLASIVGQVMRTGGTTTRKGEEIDRTLEDIGASVETDVGTSTASASLFTLKENLPQVLEILADILQHPAFPEDKIDLAKVQERTEIARRNDDVLDIARREFRKLLYGADNPYGRQTEYATIQNITRDDLVAFHDRYYHPNETILGLWGDFNTAEVKALVERIFGSWLRSEVVLPPLPEVPASWQASINLVEKDDVNQTNLRLGHVGGRFDDPDFYALDVMTEILGGGFSSRLVRHIRSDLGLAYAVGAVWAADYDHPGTFLVYCNTKSESTVKATQAILKELRGITEQPVTPEELRVAKESILNSFVFNFDTTGKIVERLMTYEYYGYPRDFLETFKDNIEKVTAEDVLRAAQKHVDPDRLVLLAVGRAQDFDQPLSTLGAVHKIDIAIPKPQPAAEVIPPATPESLARGKKLVEVALRGLGGAEAVAAVRDISYLEHVVQVMPQGELPLTSKRVIVMPDKLRQDLATPMGEISLVFDGQHGWRKTPGGIQDLPTAQVDEVRKRMARGLLHLLPAAQQGEWTPQYLETAKVDDQPADVVVLTNQSGEQVKLYIDPESGHVLEESFQGTSPFAGEVLEQHFYSDFRAVDGLTLPFATRVLQDGEKASESTVQHCEVNVGVDPALFTREGKASPAKPMAEKPQAKKPN